jgi:hypothetical protein
MKLKRESLCETHRTPRRKRAALNRNHHTITLLKAAKFTKTALCKDKR